MVETSSLCDEWRTTLQFDLGTVRIAVVDAETSTNEGSSRVETGEHLRKFNRLNYPKECTTLHRWSGKELKKILNSEVPNHASKPHSAFSTESVLCPLPLMDASNQSDLNHIDLTLARIRRTLRLSRILKCRCGNGSLPGTVQNYFNYFTEIEDRFQQRRGALLLLSTLDWALIETWREAGIPLEAVLRGIDVAFDKYEARQKRARMRRINGLAWCAQAVMEAAEQLREAAAGTAPATTEPRESGFEQDRVAAHLEAAATALDAATVAPESCAATAARLRQLAAEARSREQG